MVIAIFVCEIAGIIGSVFTTPSIPTWYAQLHKPSVAPPSWIFAPVWTTLFLLMGISLFIVWNAGVDKTDVKVSVAVFGLQLVSNILWSYLFFGLKSPLLGLIDIAVLWVLIVVTIACFSRVSKVAAIMLIPYLAWVSFASYLNYLLLMLNP